MASLQYRFENVLNSLCNTLIKTVFKFTKFNIKFKHCSPWAVTLSWQHTI